MTIHATERREASNEQLLLSATDGIFHTIDW